MRRERLAIALAWLSLTAAGWLCVFLALRVAGVL